MKVNSIFPLYIILIINLKYKSNKTSQISCNKVEEWDLWALLLLCFGYSWFDVED
jgi:hypothetical protein